ncbi:phage tail tube protein [Belliella pelovolcani]|uniref:Phage major tail protein, TP901-1 family n=1 Tax=Belliella pelovolcani TaxID=529505 RepID=A0A1N7MR14_9BACT|nr:phage tail tube protein [Belliella pelovolcani]SIS88563.1 phage major tail protein, TP901-1 family [Belliella pelovolcani]
MNIDGNKILISLSDDAVTGNTVTVLAGQTGGSIEIEKEMIEFTSKTTVDNGVPVRRYLPTRSTATINIETLYDPTGGLSQQDVMELAYQGKLVRFSIGTGVVGSKVISGKGFLSSASSDFGMDSTTTGSFTLQVDGGLSFGTVS